MRRKVSAVLVAAAVIVTAQSREKRVTPVSADLRQSFERQPKIAVLAGVGQYPSRSGLNRLRYPAHDVELLEAELTKQGYKVVALKDSEATRGSVEQSLRDGAELVDRGRGTILFFFSGHGFADKGENYLATFEASSGDLAGSGLAVKKVEALLKAAGAPRQVMFLDACRNEPGKAVGARSFERFQASAGLRELLSTKEGRISYEDDQLGSGVFTHFLVLGLRGEAAGQDGLITFRDLADYVTDGVSTFGFQHGQMQVPYEAGESSGDFLLGRAPSVPVVSTPDSPEPVTFASPPATRRPEEVKINPSAVKKPKAVKDTGEYDIYNEVIKDSQFNPPNPKKFLADLDTWTQKYRDSEFNDVRTMFYVQAYAANNEAARAVDAAVPLVSEGIAGLREGLDNEGYVLNLLFLTSRAAAALAATGTPSTNELITGSQAAQMLADFGRAYFAPERKPATMSAAQWAAGFKQVEDQAQATEFQIALYPGTSTLKANPKDPANCASAEAAFRKTMDQYPDAGLVAAQIAAVSLCQQSATPAKALAALYYYARAVSLPTGGVGGLDAASQKTIDDFLKRAYTEYHGSDDGLFQLKELAAISPSLPIDFKIKTFNEIATARVHLGPPAANTKVNPKDGLTYVWIPPGKFWMGCSPGDSECGGAEKPAHEVTITRGFWLGQTPVTQQAYQRVTGTNPSHFTGANLPVETVNWDESKAYCAAIGGKLPTEAEWEYAARAGSTAARYGSVDDIAWYSGNSGAKTHGVAQKAPNAWGLYDILGNVCQWTADWYGNYEPGAQNDPSGSTSGQFRALRGCSWLDNPRLVRVSNRSRSVPGDRIFYIGLRCVGE